MKNKTLCLKRDINNTFSKHAENYHIPNILSHFPRFKKNMYIHEQHDMFLKKKSGNVGSEFHLGNPLLQCTCKSIETLNPLHAKWYRLPGSICFKMILNKPQCF